MDVGSAARGGFRPGSDIGFLVEFQPDTAIGLLNFAGFIEDPVSKNDLKPLIRDDILAHSRVVYAA